MYDPIFSKSFTRNQRNRFRAIFLCFIIALAISLSFKPPLHLISPICDAVKTQLSINNVGNMLLVDDGSRANIKPIAVVNPAEYLQLPSDAAQTNRTSTTILTYSNHGIKIKKKHAIKCKNSNYCKIEGDIRIDAKSSTVLVATTFANTTKSWRVIEPYPRRGTSRVKNWRVITLNKNDTSLPKCTLHHTHPSLLFSMGGFTGNYFHDFADVLFPLHLTSSQIQENVQFLATDYNQWWINKFDKILNKLTKHNILDIDKETSHVHCYNQLQIGLKFDKELVTLNPNPNPSMHTFRVLLREAYSLKRERTIVRDVYSPLPRLMIIDRKRTRVLTNAHQVSRMAGKLGFEVVEGVARDLSKFAEAVNLCDVLVGVHGAGLTNMVFLPDNAVVIQVVPFGGVDGFARLDFGNPAKGMSLRYLEYKIRENESSLSRKYSRDHPVLRKPELYRNWDQVWSIYLNQQNVSVDLHRFKGILVKALKLLRHK
ncbi:alpha-1,3-arabinosyltransferase XAT3-like isoform X1 [Salvia splendens]|uniref:alpha-1,3-arabinosyltransferase XAT3-like isoform X1 n=1 Tax=Salvia splendens TaxID=180675 RepID=UPI001C2581BA|nr:alpha-1,3-arabinosyltransferase XAT3-like isoform X1 [Salvia splendens]